ncbi:AsmA family protein [Shimwellia pseudoproteus]|uniref:AsmA family protein n=1 Tax=Shimwellia pseudoproteus TaxID=570012 RepID=UPI0018EA52A9|nr:AsmA family protein [Shimwellia pseudoproteus]
MNSLKKLLPGLLIAIVVVIVALYFLAQTQWGARQITDQINARQPWHITVGKLSHSWSSPAHLVLNNITVGQPGQPPLLVAQHLDIGLSTRQLTAPGHVDSLLIQHGTLTLPADTAPALPVQADRLQLSDMAVNGAIAGWRLRAQQVQGGITPWNITGGTPPPDSQFQFSAGQLTLNDIPASQVLIAGSTGSNGLVIRSLGGDVARGTISSSLRREADGRWQVDSLRINDLRYQSASSLAAFIAPLTALPPVTFHNLDIANTQLQGPDWAVANLGIGLRNVTLENGNWQAQDGSVSLSASEALYGSLHLLDPIINASLSAQGVAIQQFTSRWAGGLLRATGSWQRSNKALTLNELTIAGLEYTLPADWKQRWAAPTPDWLNSLRVNRLSASRNLLIDIDSAFPFQFTALDSDGTQLQLIRDKQWGLWGGRLSLNAAAATINRTDLRRPSMVLEATSSTVNVSELSAFAGQGLLEATATMSQLPPYQTVLSLHGRAIPLDTLQHWGWPALPLQGDGNLQLRATGDLQSNSPLRPTVNGTLSATDAKGQQVQQTMTRGAVTGS